jgi:hypothetical protein
MTRSKEDTDLLTGLGFDPDDPAYVVERFGDKVTVTETNPEEETPPDLKTALRGAISALLTLLDALERKTQ